MEEYKNARMQECKNFFNAEMTLDDTIFEFITHNS